MLFFVRGGRTFHALLVRNLILYFLDRTKDLTCPPRIVHWKCDFSHLGWPLRRAYRDAAQSSGPTLSANGAEKGGAPAISAPLTSVSPAEAGSEIKRAVDAGLKACSTRWGGRHFVAIHFGNCGYLRFPTCAFFSGHALAADKLKVPQVSLRRRSVRPRCNSAGWTKIPLNAKGRRWVGHPRSLTT